MSDIARWYVVHTYSGYENKVASSIEKAVENRKLGHLIFEVKIPMETVTEINKDGQAKEIERKVFPGYVLVKMIVTDESWYLVRNTRGCTGFVGANSNKPEPLSDEEVANMGVEKHEVELAFKTGDSVKVCDGPLKDFIGVVQNIQLELGKAEVLVSMFGRETPVELELAQISLIEE